MKKIMNVILLLSFVLYLTACQMNNVPTNTIVNEQGQTEIPKELDSKNIVPIAKSNMIYTTAKKLSLTFNGLPEREKLDEVLQLLDEYQIKATFFVTGQRVAVEPELIELIEGQGHEIENHTLSRKSLDGLTYNEIYNELNLGKEIIENASQQKVKYVRTETTKFEEPVLKAASHSQHERYIGYSLFLTDEYLKTKFKTPKDLRIYIKRGAIIAIDLERNENIKDMLKLIVPAVNEVHYEFVTMEELLKSELEKKQYDQIPGYDLAKVSKASDDQVYYQFEHVNTNEPVIALTVDDWGTDFTVTKMLDILHEKKVKATFFVRTNGVENNPSLARSILEEGHEVANHTYSHPVITTITAEELQEEIVKSHHVLTEALQQPPTMLFRPPTGEIDSKTAKIVAATGYTNIALYDITTLDWKEDTSSEDIINIILDKADNGSIILLHMLDDIHTLEALPVVIDKLHERGFTFVTMTQLMDKEK